MAEKEEERKVKERIERLGVELHHGCYVSRDPKECHQYAEYLQSVKKEPCKAAELFHTTCKEMGFIESCLALGNMHLSGVGVAQDADKALELYDSACKAGSMGGCNNAGLVMQNRNPPNLDEAVKYFQKACDGGLKNGCFNMSGLYLQGKGTIAKDMQKALEYSLKSCELGHPWACANVSRMFQLGDGVSKDESKAREFKARAKKLQELYTVNITP